MRYNNRLSVFKFRSNNVERMNLCPKGHTNLRKNIEFECTDFEHAWQPKVDVTLLKDVGYVGAANSL